MNGMEGNRKQKVKIQLESNTESLVKFTNIEEVYGNEIVSGTTKGP